MEHRKGQRTLLAVFAHPDDESFGTGGLFALRSSMGDRVVLVTATSGEAGEISDPDLADRDNLGQVREAELRAAKVLMSNEWFVQMEPEPPPGTRYSDLFQGL